MSTATAKRSSRSKGEDTNPDYALPGIGNYLFQKTVGEGNFAKVKLAKHKLTGQEVAIKVIDKTQLDEKKLGKLYREVRIMKLLHHPHIVRLYEVIETKSTVFLVMEYANGGELYDYLVVHGRMKEKEARAKFRQILSAVSYCHKKRVIHRDLKAENLLLDSNLDIKIADFGFSNYFDPDGKLDTFCGSPPYAAPELFQGRRYVGPEVDIWSLGVILYVLTTGCLPFDGKNLQEMRESVCRGKYRIPFYLSEPCEKLLRKFLVRDPTKRASLDIILDDPWVNEGYTDSPIVQDVSMRVDEDESVIKIMESKFHIDRETTLKSLRENSYDDAAAIYYLLYHEKDLKGEHGDMKKLDIVHTSGAPSASSKVAPMGRIEEDHVLVTEKKSTNPASSHGESDGSTKSPATGRHRRFTVSGEKDAKKFGASAAPTASAGTDNAARTAAEAEVTEGMKKLQLGVVKEAPLNAATSNIGVESNGRSGGLFNQDEPREMAEEELGGGVIEDDAAAAGAAESDDKASGRRRHNTITGIFRLRKPSNETKENTNGNPDNPRSLRFTFNASTTSSKLPDDIVTEVLNGCSKLKIQAKLATRFLIECSFSGDQIKFEVEICKLPRLKNMHGLRFKRVAGSSADYKDTCEKLLSSISL